MAEIGLARAARARLPSLRPETRLRIATLVVLWIVWEAMARSGLFYRDIVPSSFSVAAALGALLADGGFYVHLWTTTYEVVAGFAIGASAGILLGILFGARPFLGKVADGYVLTLASAPKVVFLPILMTLFGVDVGSKIAMAALSAFFPIVLSTAAGMRLVNPTFVKVGRSFNLRPTQMIAKIYLPSLAVPVLTGLRLGLGVSIVGTLIAEIKLSKAGLGYLAIQYYDLFRIPEMYAVIVVIFVLAAGANRLMTRLGARAGRFGTPNAAEAADGA